MEKENNTEAEVMQMTQDEARSSVVAMSLAALTKNWKTEPTEEGEQEYIRTTYFIAAMIDEMVDADLDQINQFMINRGFAVTCDEMGALGWKYYVDPEKDNSMMLR